MIAGWIVATMVLSSAYRNTEEKIDRKQIIHLMPFKFLGGTSSSASSVEVCRAASTFSFEAWAVSRVAGSDDCSEFDPFVSLSKVFSGSGPEVKAEAEAS